MIDDKESISPMMATKIERAKNIKESLARLQNVGLFLDEAHHTYEKDKNVVKLRKQISIINKYNHLLYCIGVSGTPYCTRNVSFNRKKIELEDIQDVVYYYPLTKGIGKFLKMPDIRKIDGDRDFLIQKACDDFFNEFDFTYNNGSKSKIAFYCPSIASLNEEILPLINNWYDKHNRDKSEILLYYSEDKEYPLPRENKGHFLNLDNPTSKYRVILLVAIGTEGWDCKSLTSVCLPRQKNEKNFVLQTTCRCLREVANAKTEKALIYLDSSNYEILDSELAANYHLSISDLTKDTRVYKEYPIIKRIDNIGKLKYKNISYFQIETKLNSTDILTELKGISVKKFKETYPYENRIAHTKITEKGIKASENYVDIEDVSCDYSYMDFIYDIEAASWGATKCSNIVFYEREIKRIYQELVSNFTWFLYHPTESLYSVAKEVAKCFSSRYKYETQTISEDVEINLLDWDMESNPRISVEKAKDSLTLPEDMFDMIEGTEESYDDDVSLIKLMYKRLTIANKEKSFNYYPYRTDSSYESNFLKEILARIGSMKVELYYNGTKEEHLQSFRIKTPYGMYTPDFLCIRRNEKEEICKIMLIEIKGKPYETEAKETFVKNVFIPENPDYEYIRVGDVKNDATELNQIMDRLKSF